MKHQFMGSLIAALLITQSSCINHLSSEEGGIDTSTIPIQLSASIAPHGNSYLATRAVPDNSFADNDSIGVYMTVQPKTLSDEIHVNNEKFVYDGSEGKFVSERTLFYPKGAEKCDFYAYYPYRAEHYLNSSASITVGVQEDQSTLENYNHSSFIVASVSDIEPIPDTKVPLAFSHKFAKANIVLKCSDPNITDEQLRAAGVRLQQVCRAATYHLTSQEMSQLSDTGDIKAYYSPTETRTDGDKTCTGWSAILPPQTLQKGHTFIVLDIGSKQLECLLNEKLVLEGGKEKTLTLTIVKGQKPELEISDGNSISQWGQSNEQELETDKTVTCIDPTTLDFSISNVYRITYLGTPIAEICREYLCTSDGKVHEQAIVAYPYDLTNGKADLTKGTVCQVLGKSMNSKEHGGKVSWAKASTTTSLTYTKGTQTAITAIYIGQNKQLSFVTAPDQPLNIIVRPYLLTDHRAGHTETDENTDTNTDTNTYPIVKIGTQYWLRENLRAKRYTDGTIIPTTSLFSEQSGHCFITALGYYYNAKVINTGLLPPAGWHISTQEDCNTLKNYLNNQSALMKSGAEWSNATNLSFFSAKVTQGYNNGELIKSKNDYNLAVYWRTANDNTNKAFDAWILDDEIDHTRFLDPEGDILKYSFQVRCVAD